MTHPHTVDVVVAGLGAAGSAAAYHLARRGVRVIGVDRFAPPHAMGSSHGRSRIIREAYFEHPLYVPLVRRAYAGWEELESSSGRRIYLRTGGLMLGPEDGTVVAGARRSALEHGLPFEELTSEEIRRRFPAWRLPDDVVGIFEPRAGMLDPEAAIEAHLELARRHGADLRFGEAIVSWRADGDGVEVATSRGTYRAARLVLAVGAWTPRVLAPLGLPLVVERNVVAWFDTTSERAGARAGSPDLLRVRTGSPDRVQGRAGSPERARGRAGSPARGAQPTPAADDVADLFSPERFPVFIHEFRPGVAWYGFPDVGDGVKAGIHHSGEATDPETDLREATERDVARIRALVRAHLPAADRPLREAAVCLYTNAPDHHFLLDRHPDHSSVLVVSPCSGHGFKFAPAIGEVVADLALDGRTRFDLTPFRIDRLLR